MNDGGDDIFSRRGTSWESPTRLDRQAKQAPYAHAKGSAPSHGRVARSGHRRRGRSVQQNSGKVKEMTTSFENVLSAVPVEDWKVQQVVVFDWSDGPREGLCELARPKCCFYFEVVEERPTEDGLDDRFFSVSATPPDSVEKVLSILGELGLPSKPTWVPVWNFRTEEVRLRVERRLDDLLNDLEKSDLIVRTPDMVHFLGTARRDAAFPASAAQLRAVG